jgi:raffinose/stachyose/melibiose transport system substrate-binding protein
MTLSRRRLLGTFSLSAGAVVLAACGQSSAPAVPAATSAAAAPAATTAPAAPAAPAATSAPAAAAPPASGGAGPVTISVISWNSGSSSEAFQNAINQINTAFKQKQPNVTVNFELLGQGTTWTQAQTSRIASQTTDLTANFGFAPQDIINFQPDSQFLDLSGLSAMKNFDQINIDRFMTWKSKVWQMTLAYVGHIVWTNQDMLDKYSLKVPTNYTEWTALCESLKSNGETPILYAAKPSAALTRYTSLVEMNVGRPKHPTFWSDLLVTGKADFTTPEWIETFRRAKEFVTKEFDPAFSGIDYPTSASQFATGKYAMWPEGSFSGGDILAAKPTFQKLGAFNATFADDASANAVQPVYGDISWSGLRYSKNADTVLQWIDFFGQKENFQTFMQVLQYYPTQQIQLTGPVPQAEAPLLKQTAVSQVRLPLPGMNYDNQWSELLLQDQYTPETYAAYVQKNFDDSRPQWQKYIGMFDADWAKLYFG